MEFFNSLCKRHLPRISKRFNLEKVNGYSDITKILSIPKFRSMNYSILGFYDGDMRTSELIPKDALNWEYGFLPGESSLEEDFINFTKTKFHEINSEFNIDKRELRIKLGKLEGIEKHDWLIEFVKEIQLDYSLVVNVFTKFWEEENQESVELFIESIRKI